jgi:hypothetical protein
VATPAMRWREGLPAAEFGSLKGCQSVCITVARLWGWQKGGCTASFAGRKTADYTLLLECADACPTTALANAGLCSAEGDTSLCC